MAAPLKPNNGKLDWVDDKGNVLPGDTTVEAHDLQMALHQTFTITTDEGYAVADVKIDGKSIGAVNSYAFENVRRTHTIEVVFMKANGNPSDRRVCGCSHRQLL